MCIRDSYYSFLVNDLAVGGGETKTARLAPEARETTTLVNYSPPPSPSLGDLALRMELEGGPDRVFEAGEVLRFTVGVAEDAYVYCYYEDHTGTVVRVFPTRFQDEPKVLAGAWVQIPSRLAGYEIVVEESGASEQVACVATRNAYGTRRPFVLEEGALKTLSVRNLKSAVDQHLDADRFGTSVQYLAVRVR